MALGDVVRITVVNEDTGLNDFVNTFTYIQTQEPSLGKGDLEAAVLGWMNVIYPLYADCLSDAIGLKECKARFLPLSPEQHLFLGTGEKGTQTGDPIPNQVAPIVSWRTSLIGRSYRGRTYLPPCSESQSSGPNLTGAQLVLMSTFATAAISFTDTANGNGAWRLAIWSEKMQDVSANVESFIVPSAPGTQRKRRAGEGS